MDNIKKIYHLFKVNDYKGGELNCNVNLTEQELYNNLAIYSDWIIDDFCWEDDKSEDEIKEFIKSNDFKIKYEDIFSIYAGDDHVVIKIFKSENNKLIQYYYDFDIVREITLKGYE